MNALKSFKNENNTQINSYDNTNNKKILMFFLLAFFVMLFLRDVNGFFINKFLFVILTFCAIALLNLENIIYLFCFINPLCVGLPSKYMIILFILPFLWNRKKTRITASIFLSTLLTAVVLFANNLIFDTVNFESLIFPIEIIFVLLLYSYMGNVSTQKMARLFIYGVAALGIIMLLSELRYFSLSDLLDATNRLGTPKKEYFGNVEMRVSVDPNYYGMFSITSLVLGGLLFKNTQLKLLEKITLIVPLGIIMTVAFIGLSRSFVLVALIYAILYMVSQKRIKSLFSVLFAVLVVYLLMSILFPEIIQTLFERFTKEDSLQGANGRVDLLYEHFNAWQQNILTILFGTGLMKCNVHCMPLQYLFGGGITLFIVMLYFYVSLYRTHTTENNKTRNIFICLLPIIIMSCTIPIATSLTNLYSIIIVIYCLKKGIV